MGRHSAPDEDDDAADPPVGGAGGVALRERIDGRPTPAAGRHHAPGGEDVDGDGDGDGGAGAGDGGAGARAALADAETGRIPPVTATVDEPVHADEHDDTVVGLDDLIGADDETDDDAHGQAHGDGAAPSAHDAVTQRIPPVVDERPPPSEGSAVEITSTPFVAAAPAAVKHAAHNSADDLRLVRSSRAVLAMVVLAVLVPFAVDVVVLFVVGDVTLRRFLVWIWAPLIAAGVLVGVVLDIAHRRRNAQPAVSDA